jgi:adenylate cyclase
MTIGRAAGQCDFVVANGTVSRRHARLTLTGEALQVEDLGSTNGTAVNDTKLDAGKPVALQAGAKLRLGDVELSIHQA